MYVSILERVRLCKKSARILETWKACTYTEWVYTLGSPPKEALGVVDQIRPGAIARNSAQLGWRALGNKSKMDFFGLPLVARS